MVDNTIRVPLDDYEQKSKDQRTLEILREMTIRKGFICADTLCAMLEIEGEPWEERKAQNGTVND